MNTIRHRLAAAIRCALPVLLLPALAVAQDDARELDRIEVTGSRIKKGLYRVSCGKPLVKPVWSPR